MDRVDLAERPDWREKAEALGFRFHTMHGAPYWDETSAYVFAMEEIENAVEAPATELHALCREAAAHVVASEELMERLAIPEAVRDLVAASWREDEPELYGRLDLAYDGHGPAKLLEYNADTPTALYETAAFQWLWLEDAAGRGLLSGIGTGLDQFNLVHEALVERFAAILPEATDLHFASHRGVEEDFATVEYMAWIAREAGHVAHYVPLDAIGLTTAGQLADDESRVIGTLFKLYPWEDMLRDDFAAALAGARCRIIEPAWKALVSNKGLLAVLWRLFEGHPNLLPAYFADEVERGGAGASEAARAALERGFVRKPIFSREGASVEIVVDGRTLAASANRAYDAHAMIVQAYAPLPAMGPPGAPVHPVLGAWIVGRACVGLGIREDASPITQDLSRFKPHVVRA